MNKITNYFYIFSKLTTSLVLLFIVFLMGYALFNSYKDVEITNNNLEDKIILLSNSIDQNKDNHYLISHVFDEMKNYVEYLSGDIVYTNNQISVQIYKEWYEDVLKEYNEHTKLQRCGYSFGKQ